MSRMPTASSSAVRMARWAAGIEEPVGIDYHGHRVRKVGPWSQGPALLQQLAILKGFDIASMDPLGADFAHVMIAGLRGLGLPALYVSGYIRTIPPPGKPRLAGADASHAWVSVWCGPAFGWWGDEPTNAIADGDDHIVIAHGRDYADVPPVDGVILSFGGHELDVEVDVLPIESTHERRDA